MSHSISQFADRNPTVGEDREIVLFELALSLPEAERESYLQRACEGNADLLDSIRTRLEWEARMNGFLLEPLIPRAEPERPFEPGQVIAGRFEIIRLAGEGGMAVVYEALDTKSEQRVAVKCPKLPFRKRLTQELRSALQVTHTNICRVYEIHGAVTDSGEVDFLTMEFLDGETLAERLRREPRLTLEEIQTIGAQLCAGLRAAHARNVVHGDLKPGNIILTLADDGTTRAVITDFGLAQGMRTLTENSVSRSLRGTPDFVAPELWTGEIPSQASDIYALGVVLYEMITGTRPFANVSFASRFESKAAPLRSLAPEAPGSWNDSILACLAADPAERPSDVSTLLAPKRARVRRLRWVFAALAALLAISVPLARQWRVSPPLPPQIRLAILPPDADPESSAIGNGLAIDFSSRLHKSGNGNPVTIIPLSQVNRYHVQSTEAAMPVLGATHVLQIRSRGIGAQLGISLTVYDAAGRRPIRSFAPAKAAFGNLPKMAAAELSSAFQSELSVRDPDLRPEAYLDYVKALYNLREALNLQQAKTLIENAITADPGSPLLRLALGEAELVEYRRTRDSGARQRAETFLALARRLDRQSASVPLFAAALHQSFGEPDRALAAYDQALEREPDNASAWRGKAGLLIEMTRPDEAETALRKSVELQPGFAYPVLELGSFYYRRGRYPEARREFTRAVEMAPQLGEAHHDLAAVLTDTAEYAMAEREFQLALNFNRTPETLAGLGSLMSYQGRHAESAHYYEQAVAAGPEDHLLLSNLGDAYRRIGRERDSVRAYERALGAAGRELAARPGDAYTRSFLAYLYVRLGNVKKAETNLKQALREAPDNMKARRRGVLLYEALGRREQALALLKNAPRSIFDEISRHPDLSQLSRDLRFIQLKDGVTKFDAKG